MAKNTDSPESPTGKKTAPTPAKKEPTKIATVKKLLSRKQGATIKAIETATGWQPHSVRAALTGLRKKGVTITRDKSAKGETVYRAEA